MTTRKTIDLTDEAIGLESAARRTSVVEQDLAFQGALMDAIERGLERMPQAYFEQRRRRLRQAAE